MVVKHCILCNCIILTYVVFQLIYLLLFFTNSYTNNCPVDVMRSVYQPSKCILVDVENKDDERLSHVDYYGSSLNGWWLLSRKLYSAINPFSTPLRIPKYTELVSSLVFINHNRTIRQLLNSNLIDLYIRPELGNTQLLDYHKMNDIVEIGYRYGKVKITEFRIHYHQEIALIPNDRHNQRNIHNYENSHINSRRNQHNIQQQYMPLDYKSRALASSLSNHSVQRSVSAIDMTAIQDSNNNNIHYTNDDSNNDESTSATIPSHDEHLDRNNSITTSPNKQPPELSRAVTEIPPTKIINNLKSPTNHLSTSI